MKTWQKILAAYGLVAFGVFLTHWAIRPELRRNDQLTGGLAPTLFWPLAAASGIMRQLVPREEPEPIAAPVRIRLREET